MVVGLISLEGDTKRVFYGYKLELKEQVEFTVSLSGKVALKFTVPVEKFVDDLQILVYELITYMEDCVTLGLDVELYVIKSRLMSIGKIYTKLSLTYVAGQGGERLDSVKYRNLYYGRYKKGTMQELALYPKRTILSKGEKDYTNVLFIVQSNGVRRKIKQLTEPNDFEREAESVFAYIDTSLQQDRCGRTVVDITNYDT